MIHPPYSSELDELYPNMIYTDIYMDYPIGDVVKYWTNILINNGIRLDKINVDDNGWDGAFHRTHYKSFPWSVDILHMNSSAFSVISSKMRIDCYKVNFNLQCRDVIIDDCQECEIVKLTNNTVSIRHTGQIGYNLNNKERTMVENMFKDKWVDYLDIQSSRIIVQFWLDDYYPIFRKEKILHIKKNLLSL
jgi:hypothetical protein